MLDSDSLDVEATIARDGPLDRPTALAALERAAELLAGADFVQAARLYQRLIGFPDPAVTAAALLGLGEAWNRLDDEPKAVATWLEVTRLPETPSTYTAWRNIAGARVRAGDLPGAVTAYREADRRAPAADRAEIASRLGWLSKETGNRGAAGRYFARARGDAGASVTLVLVVITSLISLFIEYGGAPGSQLGDLLLLDKVAVAHGEVWRLLTVTLVHGGIIHLAFNMYALWLAGPFVERLYGPGRMIAFYVVFGIAGSLMTFAFSTSPEDQLGVGASGAIFGLFGLLFAAERVHRPMLDGRSRAFLGQLGGLLVINLLFGVVVPGIDVKAHFGGLVAGMWLGFLLPPVNVPTLRSRWMRAGSVPGTVEPAFGAGGSLLIRLAGIAGLVGFLALLVVIGSAAWA